MPEAYIVDAVRSPVGKRGGGLSQVHPADLGAHSIAALVERTGIDPAAVDDVIFGCVDTVGGQAGDIARTCWLAAGLPEHVPGTTVDRQCGSAQQAVHFAAQAVMAGVNDVVVAGGVQQMSMIPISSAMTLAEPLGFTDPFTGSEGWVRRYGDGEVSQFRGAELIAEKWDISREDMEAFAVESHERALRARAEGRFDAEIVPLAGLDHDEGPREPNWRRSARCPRWWRAAGSPPRCVADLRRLRRHADRGRAGAPGPRAHPPGPHPPHERAGRRPDLHAHRAHPGHRVRHGAHRHVARRHRPRRDQRGLRQRGAGLGQGDRRRPGARSTSTAAPSRWATRSAPPAPG
jgi:hypothetical protein